MCFQPSVFQNVHSQTITPIGQVVALFTLVRFLPSVNERVGLQMLLPTEGFSALGAVILLGSDVDLFMLP